MVTFHPHEIKEIDIWESFQEKDTIEIDIHTKTQGWLCYGLSYNRARRLIDILAREYNIGQKDFSLILKGYQFILDKDLFIIVYADIRKILEQKGLM